MIYVLGGANAKAAISVTYPSGSTCTCTKGSRTLTAKDTTGSCLFLLPESGTWTVSCTNGTKTASKAVTVSEHEALSISLVYGYEIFNSTVKNTRTGGWNTSIKDGQGCSTTVTDSEVGITYNSVSGVNTWAVISTKNAFRRTSEYTKIVFHVSGITGSGASVGVAGNNNPDYGSSPLIASATVSSAGNVTIPINSVSTSTDLFPSIRKHGIAQGTCAVTVDEIYFE